MRWGALLLMAACGGSTLEPQYTGWAGYIDTGDGGQYGTFLFLGTEADAGYYNAQAHGLTGPIVGLPPSLTIYPQGCDAGFPATVELNGDAAVLSYSGAACADAPNGKGTLWKFYERR